MKFMLTLGNKFAFLSISHKTWFEKWLVSFTTLQVAFIVGFHRAKLTIYVTIFLDLSQFLVLEIQSE